MNDFYVNRKARDGRQSCCKACRRAYLAVNRERVREVATAAARRRGVQPFRPAEQPSGLARYGLTQQQYDELLEGQCGVCAICGQGSPDSRRLAVDHCHQTGAVRGLLCHRCNMGIGLLADDPARVASALAYLEAAS